MNKEPKSIKSVQLNSKKSNQTHLPHQCKYLRIASVRVAIFGKHGMSQESFFYLVFRVAKRFFGNVKSFLFRDLFLKFCKMNDFE